MCNRTIRLSDHSGMGRLVFNHYRHYNSQSCRTEIKAKPGYRIGYAFSKKSAYRMINRIDDNLYYFCTSVVFYQGDVEIKYNCLNHSSNSTKKELETTRLHTLTLWISGDNSTSFNFELIFFFFHYGRCYSNEMSCRLLSNEHGHACVGQNSVQDNDLILCDRYDRDDNSDYNYHNSGMIAGIVLACVIFVPLIFSCACFIYRKNCRRPEPDVEDIPTRARRIFAAIVADAHDNAGFDDGPIDPSKFDPPPEYDSLDQLDKGRSDQPVSLSDKRLSQISDESPPNYHHVMNNSNEYLVSCHI